MPDRKVVRVKLYPEVLYSIIKDFPDLDRFFYFQGIPGPEPEFTEDYMCGLSPNVEVHFFPELMGFNIWSRKTFLDEWKRSGKNYLF